jgi:hypothetical protein
MAYGMMPVTSREVATGTRKLNVPTTITSMHLHRTSCQSQQHLAVQQ